ncbi:MAG: amino acid adenylation domain-containing protein, partial [Myxococcales bacterium]|nr:amino acid adenylation domain-containing protein [Myxococcales bacterium]
MAPPRDLSRTPIFQVMFALDDTPELRVALHGLEATLEEADAGVAKFELTLGMRSTSDGLVGALEYATDLFERETAERLAGQLVRLLEAAVANPELRVSRLPLVTPEEWAELEAWSRPDEDIPPGGSVLGRVRAHAARSPEASAVEQDALRLSYRELVRRVDELAERLNALGIGPEDRVAVCLERSVDLVVALLAVLEAGGVYVPLDPAYPAAQLEWRLADASAGLVVTNARLSSALGGAEHLLMDSPAPLSSRTQAPRLAPEPEQAAYMVYTSGSTGQPRGVVVPHAALENLVTAIVPAYGLRPDDRALQYSATAFDTSIEEILGTLARGATLVLRSKEDSRSFGRAFVKWCREQDVSVVSVPTALWHGLARAGEVAAFPECVRTVIIGSERALPDALETCVQRLARRCQVINSYGPTEATVTATCWRLDTPSSGLDTVPIGRPLAGVRAYVLDRYLAPVPVGHPGELCIGGAGVARGYHARPGNTAERFVPDPFGPPGARLYRTGDRVRWRRDGHLEYLGRQDEQLKIRGYRVEPGEVEAALSSLPGVEGCVVGSWGEGDAERLCAWVAGPGATDPSALRRGLAAALPEYMVPGAFVALDALPLTPNGKLDRRALPAPVLSVGEGADPATRSESHLAALFCELLGVDRAGREDDFFALGG